MIDVAAKVFGAILLKRERPAYHPPTKVAVGLGEVAQARFITDVGHKSFQ